MPSLKRIYGFSREKADKGVWIVLQEAHTLDDGTVIDPAMRVKLGKIMMTSMCGDVIICY